MNPFNAIWQTYLRWRHSKGFGVHSPYAFSIIERVINLGDAYGFYGYHHIKKVIKQSRLKHPERCFNRACLLLRLLVAVEARNMVCSGDLNPVIVTVAKSAGVRLHTLSSFNGTGRPSNDSLSSENDQSSETKTLYLLNGGKNQIMMARRAIGEMNPLFAIDPDPELRRLLETCIPEGVVFTGPNLIIALPRPHTAFVLYSCRL